MAGRDVTQEDEPKLQGFACAHPDRWWEFEVEEAIHEAALWITERSSRWVRAFDAGNELAVVVGYELISPVDPEEGAYLPFLAVASKLQGDGYAEEALDDLMPILRELTFGGPVTCRIHVRNRHSQKFATKKGFVIVESGSDDPDYQLWRSR